MPSTLVGPIVAALLLVGCGRSGLSEGATEGLPSVSFLDFTGELHQKLGQAFESESGVLDYRIRLFTTHLQPNTELQLLVGRRVGDAFPSRAIAGDVVIDDPWGISLMTIVENGEVLIPPLRVQRPPEPISSWSGVVPRTFECGVSVWVVRAFERQTDPSSGQLASRFVASTGEGSLMMVAPPCDP